MIDWARKNADNPQSTLSRNPVARAELIDRYIEAQGGARCCPTASSTCRTPAHPEPRGVDGEAVRHGADAAHLPHGNEDWSGLYGQIWDRESDWAPVNGQFARSYVSSVSSTIAGGTSEIQRNIIAQRGLGMPRG